MVSGTVIHQLEIFWDPLLRVTMWRRIGTIDIPMYDAAANDYVVLICRSRSFIVPGFIMGIVGFIVFLFVVDSPAHVGVQVDMGERRRIQHPESGSTETDSLLSANVMNSIRHKYNSLIFLHSF